MRLGDTALDLPAALLGVHARAGVGGLHRLQNAHLPVLDVDRDPERRAR